jgi:phosphatidylglycerol:prolipoprotein diacylglycerol transferase
LYPILFKLGPFTIYSFGVLMALGFYVASLASVSEYRRRGGDPEPMWNLLVWIFVAGLVGSRLLSLLNDPAAVLEDPLHEILAGAGFVWYGGLLAGTATAFLLTRRYGIRFGTLVECTAPGLAIGQAIGRIGCHVAGDGDWGVTTDLPWGVAYTQAIVGWDYAPGVRVHPTPLYEAAAYTLVFLVLWRLRTRNPPEGTLFSVYLIGSSLARFAIEFIRINPKVALGLSQAQWIALLLMTCGAAWLLRVRGAPAVSSEVPS